MNGDVVIVEKSGQTVLRECRTCRNGLLTADHCVNQTPGPTTRECKRFRLTDWDDLPTVAFQSSMAWPNGGECKALWAGCAEPCGCSTRFSGDWSRSKGGCRTQGVKETARKTFVRRMQAAPLRPPATQWMHDREVYKMALGSLRLLGSGVDHLRLRSISIPVPENARNNGHATEFGVPGHLNRSALSGRPKNVLPNRPSNRKPRRNARHKDVVHEKMSGGEIRIGPSVNKTMPSVGQTIED